MMNYNKNKNKNKNNQDLLNYKKLGTQKKQTNTNQNYRRKMIT